jgi:hypothetical protein
MNAQQLINETPTEESFDYSVFFKSLSKHNNDDRGDEIVGLPQSCPNKFECQSPQSPDLLDQININNIKNTETFKGDVIRSMGIEVL